MNRTFLCSLLAILLILSACGNKNALIGEWKLSEIDIEKAIEIFDDEQKDFARSEMTQAFENVKGKMTLSFEEDGSYSIATPLINGEMTSESGRWRLSLSGKKLILRPKTSDKETHRILKLTDTELIMEMNQAGYGEMGMTFIKD
jgi:hypothetical protein